jgi:hypothetical protein
MRTDKQMHEAVFSLCEDYGGVPAIAWARAK